jgi:hypothetical protein
MTEINITQSAWKRALKDTQDIVGSLVFWIVDVLVSAIIGAITTNPWLGAGVLVGIVVLVFGFTLLRAPIRQRNEAREEIRRIQDNISTIPVTLNEFIAEGTALRGSLFTSWDSDRSQEISQEVQDWTNRVCAYLSEHLPQFAAHFMNEGVSTGGAYAGPAIRSNYATVMDRRLQRLGEILLTIDS